MQYRVLYFHMRSSIDVYTFFESGQSCSTGLACEAPISVWLARRHRQRAATASPFRVLTQLPVPRSHAAMLHCWLDASVVNKTCINVGLHKHSNV